MFFPTVLKLETPKLSSWGILFKLTCCLGIVTDLLVALTQSCSNDSDCYILQKGMLFLSTLLQACLLREAVGFGKSVFVSFGLYAFIVIET